MTQTKAKSFVFIEISYTTQGDLSMEKQKDMPRWNQFVNDVLSGRFKEQKEEAKYSR